MSTTTNHQTSRWRRVLQRIAQQSLPYWLGVAVVIGATIGSIVLGAYTTDERLAKTFETLVIPISTLLAGAVINDVYHRLGEDKHLVSDVKKSTYASLAMLQNVLVVSQRLGTASDDLNEERYDSASTSIAVALAMITASLRQVVQNLRLWASLSESAYETAQAEFQADDSLIEPPAREEIPTGNEEQDARV